MAEYVERLKDEPEFCAYLDKIISLREEVALKMGLKSEMDEVATLPDRIRRLLETRGYTTGKENYIQTLSQGLALLPWPFTAAISFTEPLISNLMNTGTCLVGCCLKLMKTTP